MPTDSSPHTGATDAVKAGRPPNTRLRAARRELGKSREELARLLEKHARQMKPPVSGFICYPAKIKRWEEGMPPRNYVVPVLTSFFGKSAAELGLHVDSVDDYTSELPGPTVAKGHAPRPSAKQEDDVDRRQLIAGAAVLAGIPALGPLSRSTTPPIPTTVGRREIEHVRRLSVAFARAVDAHGGEFARTAVVPELEWSAELLHSTCPRPLRSTLFVAVAQLAGVGAFAMFDAYDHANARTAFRFGVSCAEEADDWSLRAQILGDMARQALWVGEPDQALTHVEMAQVRADRLTHAERAKLATIRARILAQLGRVKETLRAVGHADEEYAQATPADERPWLSYRHAALLNDTGHALADLALLGHPADARPRLEAAISAYSDSYARSRAISEAKLASLTMATGDPHEAVAMGSHVLTTMEQVHSRRVTDHLAELDEQASKHQSLAGVAELRERIAAAIGA